MELGAIVTMQDAWRAQLREDLDECPRNSGVLLVLGVRVMVTVRVPITLRFLTMWGRVWVRVRLRVRVRVRHRYLQHTKVKELSSVILIREDVIEAWLGLGLG